MLCVPGISATQPLTELRSEESVKTDEDCAAGASACFCTRVCACVFVCECMVVCCMCVYYPFPK